MNARLKLVDGYTSIADNGRGHAVVLDLPKESGGADLGMKPLEAVVASLLACIAMTAKIIGGNKQVRMGRVELSAEVERVKEKLSRVVIQGWIESDDEEKARRVFADTIRVCPVGFLFEKAGVVMEHKIDVKPLPRSPRP